MSVGEVKTPVLRARRRRRFAVVGGLVLSSLALGVQSSRAGRPPEALEAERHAQRAAIDYLIKKTDSLSTSLSDRQTHLKKRLRAMYKMSQGGYLKLVFGADTPARVFARRDAAQRMLSRDLDELSAVRGELVELSAMRDELRDGERRVRELEAAAKERVPQGLARHEALLWPVAGAITRPFGVYKDPGGLEYGNDGVELRTEPGDSVLAPSAGVVRFVGEVPGIGGALVLDHGEGWATLLGRVTAVTVRPGDHVTAGLCVAHAAADSLQFQVEQGGAWLDPAQWLEVADVAAPRSAGSSRRRAVRGSGSRATLVREKNPARPPRGKHLSPTKKTKQPTKPARKKWHGVHPRT